MYVAMSPGKPRARTWGHHDACVELTDGTALILMSDEDCDDLIAAACEAKKLRLARQAEKTAGDDEYRLTAKGEAAAEVSGYCPASLGPDDDYPDTLYCDRENGHPGSHHAPGPDEGSEVAWSDEPASVAS